jgi:hypothetical protein
MSTIVQPLSNLSSFAYLYVLGGDTYVTDFSDYNYIPGQIDTQWENGYKNDGNRFYFPFDSFVISFFSVWRTTGTTWFRKGDIRVRTSAHRKVPRLYSKMSWHQLSIGDEESRPERGMTYADWIACQPVFKNEVRNNWF